TWPEEKFVDRKPVIESPAVTPAAACSPSGSMNISGRPEMFRCPLADSSAQYSPICVDGVIGYAPAASLDSRSHMMTAVLPSIASRTPGYLKVFLFVFIRVHSWLMVNPPAPPGAPTYELSSSPRGLSRV